MQPATRASVWVLACLVEAVGAVEIELVPVGNPGNPGELTGAGAGGYGPDHICGAVQYPYQIGKYEVTIGAYAEFLNAVARIDTYRLYPEYGSPIQRSGSGTAESPYVYTVTASLANRPANRVYWGNAARFCNWLENGQPAGAQDSSTTEDGSYYINGAQGYVAKATRKPGAHYVLPTEDEWYKAAYHKNDGVTGHYWDYPTSSDVMDRSMALYASPDSVSTDVDNYASYPSPYGTLNQGGNVAEITEDRYVRGGSCYRYHPQSWLNAATFYTTIQFDQSDFDYFGFRVAYVPEPVTLALSAFAVMVLARTRGRRF